MAHDVFVSYSAKDKPTADAVCATLESRGIRCWIAPRDILPGMDWGEAIIDAINSSRAIVLVFSANANQSSQIKREVERAVSKGIPIIPFRIEDVPLSKSLEYLISTPHWLDALTPPMERHAQFLAQTINVLLHRTSNEQTGVEQASYIPENSMQPPAETKSSGFKLGIIAGLIGVPVILGLFFLVFKFIFPDGPKPGGDSNVGLDERPADVSRGGVMQSRVDPKLVGEWKTSVVIDLLPWDLNWTISEAGKFKFVGTANDIGRFNGKNGNWNRRSNTGQRDYGTYFFNNANSLTMTGLGGTTMLSRTGSSIPGVPTQIDPQLLGKWKADIVVKGTPLKIYFEVLLNETYRTLIVNEDSGSIEASDGSWKQISSRGDTIQGNYTFINQNAASISGPLGTAVWNRIHS